MYICYSVCVLDIVLLGRTVAGFFTSSTLAFFHLQALLFDCFLVSDKVNPEERT